MSALLKSNRAGNSCSLYVELAKSDDAVLASKRLRYEIFANELGAHLHSADKGIDEDKYDEYCQHLLVREHESGQVIATTRLLMDEQARLAGGFYSENEFSMPSILALPGRRLEIGRTCVHPRHRQGAAIAVLWSGLATFINRHQIDHLFGCASIDMNDGGHRARAIMARLRNMAMLPLNSQVTPRLTLPPAPVCDTGVVKTPLPPLLKAYIRLGARVAGEPCFDPDFNVADVLVLVDVQTMDRAYARHFLQRTPRVDPR